MVPARHIDSVRRQRHEKKEIHIIIIILIIRMQNGIFSKGVEEFGLVFVFVHPAMVGKAVYVCLFVCPSLHLSVLLFHYIHSAARRHVSVS